MSPRHAGTDCRYIVVADEDRTVVNFVIETLIADGDLVISNTRVGGLPGPDLIDELRAHLPRLPILYLADHCQSQPGLERRLPQNVPILREPFTADELRAVVKSLLGRARRPDASGAARAATAPRRPGVPRRNR
jgi:DNA-binding response OmpR family regulator